MMSSVQRYTLGALLWVTPSAALAQNTLPVSAPAASMSAPGALTFTARPGVTLEFKQMITIKTEVTGLQLLPLAGKTLSAKTVQDFEEVKPYIQKSLNTTSSINSKLFVKVLPPLADGTQVVLLNMVLPSEGGSRPPFNLEMIQQIKPDGSMTLAFPPTGDKATDAILSGAKPSLGYNLQAGGINLYGRPLAVGGSVSQDVNVDLEQLFGSALSEFAATPKVSGNAQSTSTVTLTALRPDGVRVYRSDLNYRPFRVDLDKGKDASLSVDVQGGQGSGTFSYRPDGLPSEIQSTQTIGFVMDPPLPADSAQMHITFKTTQSTMIQLVRETQP